MKFDLYELEKLQQTLLSPRVTVSLVRVQQIAFRYCFTHCPPHKVQCTCFSVAKLLTVYFDKIQNHFTPTFAGFFASCLRATMRISDALEQLARKIVTDAIPTVAACLTLHPKA